MTKIRSYSSARLCRGEWLRSMPRSETCFWNAKAFWVDVNRIQGGLAVAVRHPEKPKKSETHGCVSCGRFVKAANECDCLSCFTAIDRQRPIFPERIDQILVLAPMTIVADGVGRTRTGAPAGVRLLGQHPTVVVTRCPT